VPALKARLAGEALCNFSRSIAVTILSHFLSVRDDETQF
jgi:hypothetical protein